MKNLSKTTQFFIILFGISYIAAALFYLLGGKLSTPEGFAFAILYMFTPLVATIIVQKLIHKEELKRSLLISFKINKWFFVACFLPPVIILTSLAVALLFPGVSYSPGMEGFLAKFESMLSPGEMEEMRLSMESMPIHPIIMILLQGIFAGITINAIAGFGEEIGWRGFLIRQFKGMSFVKASLIIGFVWGIWHAPLILMGHNYPEFPIIGVGMMTIMCILFSPLFLYITIKAKSVIAASIMHGTINGTVALSIVSITGGHELAVGIMGLAGFIAIGLFIALFFLYDKYLSKERIMNKTI